MHKGLHKVLEVKHLSKHTFRLRVERNDMPFVAGQCVNIGLPKAGVNREYSSYSGEADPELSFLIRGVDDGQVSSRLQALKPGDAVEIDGAYGLFTIPNPNDKKSYVFIGTGTGIAPFHCFVKSYPQIDYLILHGTRLAEENYDAAHYGPDRYIQCVSAEEGGNFHGRVTDYLRKHPLGTDKTYYLCGNRNMINEIYDILREQGVSGTQIITEVFF
jgi:ferredoxin/flavodoxin---NADP+ reductase